MLEMIISNVVAFSATVFMGWIVYGQYQEQQAIYMEKKKKKRA